jgi:CheY-like chemotaxis protein
MKKRQLLAIDDSKAIRFLIQTIFGKKYQVITASDGCSAMYWLTKQDLPDLIIADPQLPDMKNWELIEHLRSSGLYKHIPVVVLSNLPKNETNNKARELGLIQTFVKPFNPVDLIKAVENITTHGAQVKDSPLTLV